MTEHLHMSQISSVNFPGLPLSQLSIVHFQLNLHSTVFCSIVLGSI